MAIQAAVLQRQKPLSTHDSLVLYLQQKKKEENEDLPLMLHSRNCTAHNHLLFTNSHYSSALPANPSPQHAQLEPTHSTSPARLMPEL